MSQPQHMKTKHTTEMGMSDKSVSSELRTHPLSSPMKRTIMGCIIGTTLILILQVKAGGSALALLSSLFYSLLFSLTILWAVHWIGGADDNRSFSWSPIGKMAVKAAVLGIVLEAGTLFGSPFHSPLSIQDWSIKQTLLWICIAFSIITLIDSLRKTFLNKHANIIIHGLKTALPVITLSLIISLLLGITLQHPLNISFIYLFSFFFFVCTLMQYLIIAYKQNVSIEWFFLITALSLGLSFSFLLPHQTFVSWDDQIHFDYTNAISYLVNPAYDEADITLANDEQALRLPLPENVVDESIPTSLLRNHETKLNDLNWKDADEIPGFLTYNNKSIIRYDCVGYFPAAAGLWLGRLLHLPTTGRIIASHITYLLFYVLICFLAIKIIPIKKTLMSCIALFPTLLFLANSFSSDPFIFCFMLLSVALVLRQALAPRSLSWWPFIAIFVTMLLACAPKIVYFPLFLLILLIPEYNFPSKIARYYIKMGLFVFAAVCILSLVVLAFTTSGDTRGGSEVDLQKQLQFVLTHPVEYAKTLFGFLFNQYLSPSRSYEYSIFFAYLGGYNHISYFFDSIIAMILTMIACMDSDKLSQRVANWEVRFFVLGIVMITVILIATSLYLSYTVVASTTIAGCQPRYLLPLIFPAICLCFNWRLENQMQTRSFSLAVMILMSTIGFIGIWLLVLPMGI